MGCDGVGRESGHVAVPVDGCTSFVNGFTNVVAGDMDPHDCFAPLRFSVGDTNYCIQDDQAHTWQLCPTPDAETQPTPVVEARRDDLRRDRLGLGCVPALVDEQRLGFCRDLPGLLEDRLDRARVFLARDDLPRQGEQQVVQEGLARE